MTKKILDLSGLQRYDTKLKDYVTEEVSKCGLDPIPNTDVEALFEEKERQYREIQSPENFVFVNTNVSNGIVQTVVINNSSSVFEGSDFVFKVLDSSSKEIVKCFDVITRMEIGTTQEINTDTGVDLSEAAAIEYSLIEFID